LILPYSAPSPCLIVWQTHGDVSETAAASIIMVYTQADTVQRAYTGTETDLIFCRFRQVPFHTVRILGRVNVFCYRQVSVIFGFRL